MYFVLITQWHCRLCVLGGGFPYRGVQQGEMGELPDDALCVLRREDLRDAACGESRGPVLQRRR